MPVIAHADRATAFVARGLSLGELLDALASAVERGDERRERILAAEVRRRGDVR